MVHGDNAWGWATLRDLFSRTGEADIIVGYTRDMLQSIARSGQRNRPIAIALRSQLRTV